MSLRYVISGDTKILCLKLKEIIDKLFTEIREGMKTLSLDDIKEILRIEVRKQIKHTQHYYLGTNVFDEEQTIQSLEIVSSRETKMKEELYGENIKEYEKELDNKLAGNQRSKRWCFDVLVEPNRPDKRLKTQSSRRIVPIQDTLLDLGFLNFINLLKKDTKRKRVFEELDYRERIYGRSISRFWNNSYLPLIGIKTERNRFHSFRHSVIDHLKQLGVEPHFINELIGHSQGNIDLDRYVKGYNPDILYNKCAKRIVCQSSHKRGIDFLALKLDWKKIIE